ncbi:unnamed protein product [Cuscuta campestris]|uniref:Uncharacterized protein n=1 Tax=Cuscuta campestris TaxID=132261 RepID=A0A484LWI6_9ASTE|nr:unnamed protein product [Cuscuta campestris]
MAIALDRPVDPDELVCFTRRHTDGSWIDDRSKEIYDKYQEAIHDISSQASIGGTQPEAVDSLTKLQTWCDTVGGKNHSRVWKKNMNSKVIKLKGKRKN